MKNKRNRSPFFFFNSRLTATVSISLVLFLAGLVLLLFLAATNLTNYVRENLSFDIMLTDDMNETQVNNLQKQIEKSGFARSVEYISKEDAARQMGEELGMDPSEFLGFNPLPALLVVHLDAAYAHVDSIPAMESKIKGISTGVREIEFRRELMELTNNSLAKIGLVILGMAVILLFISFTLINNTIRLTVYSKRFLIHTMKLVGATDGFIRAPFIRSQIGTGICAAVIACMALAGLLFYLFKDRSGIVELAGYQSLALVAATILLLGIIITWTATYFAVNKYIRMKGDDLFYI